MLQPTLIKVYKVDFIKYTDCRSKRVLKDDAPFNIWSNPDSKHILKLPENGPLLVPEYDLPFYSQFGNGYFKIEYVGSMYIPSLNDGFRSCNLD